MAIFLLSIQLLKDAMDYPEMSNIPMMNLIEEFEALRLLVGSPSFEEDMTRKGKPIPIDTPLLTWYGQPNALLTLIMQRAILGLESYIIGATWGTAGRLGILTTELNRKIRNPFSIPATKKTGTAERYYDLLPSLLHESISLRVARPDLWSDIRDFYKKFRNPLFHGQQIYTSNPKEIRPLIELIHKIYLWIEEWYAPAPETVSFAKNINALIPRAS